MSKIQKSLVILFFIFLYCACGTDEELSPIPEIKFLGMTKDTMEQSFFNLDTVLIALSFVDGDGDIGKLENSSGLTLLIKDLRTDELYDRFSIPALPSNGKTLRGEMFVRLFTTCCVFPDNIPPCETADDYPTNELDLEITMFDRAGHMSNVIRTPTITLLCN